MSFGFAAPGSLKSLALGIPLILALMAAAGEGIDGTLVLRLVLALALTAAGVVVGIALDRGAGRRADARHA